MDSMQRKKNAAAFASEWSGRGYEKGDAQVFWTELLQQIAGMQSISRNVRFEYRTASGGFIDCLIPDAGVIIEQKGLGVDLDKPEERQGRMVTPFEQALAYAESFPRNRQPRFVVVCNFSTFRVHDRDAYSRSELAGKYVEFTLDELGQNPHLLDFITDPANSRSEREKQVSMEAGRLIGELHSLLQAQYIDPESKESQKALNILCVRLVFCLFCEDAELFPKDALLNYLRNVEPKNMRVALKRLFKALDTPIDKLGITSSDELAPEEEPLTKPRPLSFITMSRSAPSRAELSTDSRRFTATCSRTCTASPERCARSTSPREDSVLRSPSTFQKPWRQSERSPVDVRQDRRPSGLHEGCQCQL